MTNPFAETIQKYPPKYDPTNIENFIPYADGGTNDYVLSEHGHLAHAAGYDSVPLPVDWFDQMQHAQQVIEATLDSAAVDKLTAYDPVCLGRLRAVADHFDAIIPSGGKTKMSSSDAMALSGMIRRLDTTNVNKSVIAFTLVPVLLKIATNFDPYTFIEEVVGP